MWDVEQSASAIAQALAEDIDAINADLKAESIALGAAVDQEVQAFSEQARPELETSVRQQGPVLDELYDCSICQSAGARCAIAQAAKEIPIKILKFRAGLNEMLSDTFTGAQAIGPFFEPLREAIAVGIDRKVAIELSQTSANYAEPSSAATSSAAAVASTPVTEKKRKAMDDRSLLAGKDGIEGGGDEKRATPAGGLGGPAEDRLLCPSRSKDLAGAAWADEDATNSEMAAGNIEQPDIPADGPVTLGA
eukprot:2093853-Rhodomonas_salina.2